MSWNYRVFRQEHVGGEVSYSIREVYYDLPEKGDKSWTEDEMAPHGGTLEELRTDLRYMMEATDKPVLQVTERTLEEYKGERDDQV